MDTPHLFDAHSFNYLLQTFGFVEADGRADARALCKWLEGKGGFVHGTGLPEAMFDKHADACGLVEEQRATLKELLHFAAAPDIGLGCVARPWRAAYLEALQAWHDYSQQPAAIVQCDFRNMANANDTLGRRQVDRLMKLMTKQAERIFSGGGDKSAAGVTVVRPGGDEVEFLITGLDSNELSARMREVDKATQGLLRDLGTVTISKQDTSLPDYLRQAGGEVDVLSLLSYKKSKDDKHRTGFGMGMGAVMLQGQHLTMEQLQNALDADIKRHKEQEGAECADKHAQQFGGAMQWQPLSPQQVRALLPLTQVGQVIAEAAQRLGVSAQLTPRPAWPPHLPLAASIDAPQRDLYTAQKEALADFAATLATPAQQDFTHALGKLVNMRDPQTGFKAARMLPGSLEYLRTHSPSRLVLAELELSNLVTLNNLLGTEGANQFKEAVTQRVVLPALQESLPEAFMPARDVYHAGGSRMRLLLRDIEMPKVEQALRQVVRRVEQEINQRPLGEALDFLGLPALKESLDAHTLRKPCTRIAHPKKEQRSVAQGRLVPRGGFELMYGAMQVESAISAARTINLLEALKESYEAHPVLLREQLHEKGALFWHTSDTAWLVGNVQDSTGLMQGIPELFHQVIVERGERHGRSHYPALLLEGHNIPTTLAATHGSVVESMRTPKGKERG